MAQNKRRTVQQGVGKMKGRSIKKSGIIVGGSAAVGEGHPQKKKQ